MVEGEILCFIKTPFVPGDVWGSAGEATKPRAAAEGGVVLVGAAQIDRAVDARHMACAGVLPHPVGAGGALAAVIGEPEVVGGECIHCKGSVRKIRVGVDHGVEIPGFELGGGLGHPLRERGRGEGTQPGVLHINGKGQLERFPAQRGPQGVELRFGLPGGDGAGVIVAAHRDAARRAGSMIALELRVGVGLAVSAAQHPQHHAVDGAGTLHRVPVYAALPAGDIQHPQRGHRAASGRWVGYGVCVMEQTSFLLLS